MRKARWSLWSLALGAACGGRAVGDWPAASSGGESSGAASGALAIAGSGGALFVSGGSFARSGASSFGGVAAGGVTTGGVAAGGVTTGGVTTGGVTTGGVTTGGSGSGGAGLVGAAAGGVTSGGQAAGGRGSGGRPCFETTQTAASSCIHVRLCSEAQYETLCLLDTPTSAVCFCYTDGVVTSSASVQSASYASLCAEAERSRCPVDAD